MLVIDTSLLGAAGETLTARMATIAANLAALALDAGMGTFSRLPGLRSVALRRWRAVTVLNALDLTYQVMLGKCGQGKKAEWVDLHW